MNLLYKINPAWPLRLGLGVMYLYSGIDLMRHPTAWHWALPYWFRQIIVTGIPLNTYLEIQGAVEVVFALVLLAWFLPRSAARIVVFLSILEFGAILVFAFLPFSEANFLITFRDIGLLGAAIALYILIGRYTEQTPSALP